MESATKWLELQKSQMMGYNGWVCVPKRVMEGKMVLKGLEGWWEPSLQHFGHPFSQMTQVGSLQSKWIGFGKVLPPLATLALLACSNQANPTLVKVFPNHLAQEPLIVIPLKKTH